MEDVTVLVDRQAGDSEPLAGAVPADLGDEVSAAVQPSSDDYRDLPQASARGALIPFLSGREHKQPSPAQIVEALLFASDTPLSAARLAELAEIRPADVPHLVAELNEKYAAAGITFRIERIARGYQMMTQARFEPWLSRLNEQRSQTRLSPAALETLAIIAYKQPIIRAQIEAIRGVECGEVINRLRQMGLVRVVGRAEIVGRPLLYGTTKKFLDVFGLGDLDDLPPLESLSGPVPVRAVEVPPETPAAAVAAGGCA